MRLLTIAGAAMLLTCLAFSVTAEGNAFEQEMKKTPDQLIAEIESKHPAVYYLLAGKLFDAGRKDEAVFWFYAGQLRYRFLLAARPDPDPSGEQAAFASLSKSMGEAINAWAFGDLGALEKTLVEVKAWDEKAPNGYTSKETYSEQWKATREGMDAFVKYLHDNGDSIREKRKAAGLESRN